MLFGGSIFAIFGGLYYWWPKMFGRMLDERLGKLHFWLVFVGFNLTFFPLHMLGLLGMPRRVYTYKPRRAVGGLQHDLVDRLAVMTFGMLIFVANIMKTFRSGPRAGNDPWHADTLEWYTTSPPPPWNFDRVPYVTSARPLRDLRRRLAESRGGLMGSLGPPDGRCRGRRHRPRSHLRRRRLGHGAPRARRRRAAAARRAGRHRLDLGAPRAARRVDRARASSGSPRCSPARTSTSIVASAAFAATAVAAARTFRGVEPAAGSRRATTST